MDGRATGGPSMPLDAARLRELRKLVAGAGEDHFGHLDSDGEP